MNANNYKPNDIHYSYNDLWGDVQPVLSEPVAPIINHHPVSTFTQPPVEVRKEEVKRFGFRYYNRTEALASGFDWDS